MPRKRLKRVITKRADNQTEMTNSIRETMMENELCEEGEEEMRRKSVDNVGLSRRGSKQVSSVKSIKEENNDQRSDQQSDQQDGKNEGEQSRGVPGRDMIENEGRRLKSRSKDEEINTALERLSKPFGCQFKNSNMCSRSQSSSSVGISGSFGRDNLSVSENDNKNEENRVMGGRKDTRNANISQYTRIMRLFCDISVHAIIIIDEYGTIITFNAELLRMFGYNRWELVGKNVNILMEPRIARLHDKFLSRYRRTHVNRIIGETRDRIHGLRKSGELFQMLLNVIEYNEDEDHIFIGLIRDLSSTIKTETYRNLLGKLLPDFVAERMLGNELSIAERYVATVGFIDLVGYTSRVREMRPLEIVRLLSEIFGIFDSYLEQHDCFKIKTIGDCYMYSSILTHKHTAHAINGILFALACIRGLLERRSSVQSIQSTQQVSGQLSMDFDVHVGIGTGEIIGGIVPGSKIAFDVWGNVVNMASRLEDMAGVNEILVSRETWYQSRHCIGFDELGKRSLKGFGEVEVYRVRGEYEDYSLRRVKELRFAGF